MYAIHITALNFSQKSSTSQLECNEYRKEQDQSKTVFEKLTT